MARISIRFVQWSAIFLLVCVVLGMIAWQTSAQSDLGAARQLAEIALRRLHDAPPVLLFKEDEFRQDFMRNGVDAVVAAEQQSRMRALVIAHHCELASVATLPSRDADGEHYLALRLIFRGELDDVQGVLYDIEMGKPLFFVERASLRSEVGPWAASRKEPTSSTLVAEVDIYGAVMPEPKTGSADIRNSVRLSSPLSAFWRASR